MADPKDKRQQDRVKKSVPIIVSPNESHGRQQSLDYYDCYSKDLSAEGAKIITHEPFAVGECLEIIVEPENDHRRYLLLGKVKWSLQIDDAPTYYTGIHFLDAGESDCASWQKNFH